MSNVLLIQFNLNGSIEHCFKYRDKREKIHAFSLAKECYVIGFDSTTNAEYNS